MLSRMDEDTDFRRRALEQDTRSKVRRKAADEARVPVLTVAWHADIRRVGQRATLPSAGVTPLSRSEPIFGGGAGRPGPLADPFLSRKPWQLQTRTDGAVELRRAGSSIDLRLDGEPADGRLITADELGRSVVLEVADRVVLVLHLGSPVPSGGPEHGMIGRGPAMEQLRREIDRVASLRLPLLLRGESGTGKELVAQAVHQAGPRRDGPFVTVNMAAVPPSLAASELFGAEKGAFSGADRKRQGFFAAADGGTLFLDEVGDTPADAQALLLRALESGEIQPVGATAPRRVDVRVIAATDLDLEDAMDAGTFRTPLFHRLSGFELLLPPLCERREDVGLLLAHFLRRELDTLHLGRRLDLVSADGEPWIGADLVAPFLRFGWPGNVRQLRNVAGQIVAASHDREGAVLPDSVRRLFQNAEPEPAQGRASTSPATKKPATRRAPADLKDDEILDALRRCRWRIKPAADELGISRPSLYKLMEERSRFRLAGDLDESELRRAHGAADGHVAAMVEDLEISPDALRRRLRELGLEIR